MITFVGDSITEFWSAYRPFFFEENGFANCGVGRSTTVDLIRTLHSSAARGTDGVHIMIGINDVAQINGPISDESIRINLKEIIQLSLAIAPNVWIGAITPSDHFPWSPHLHPAQQIMALNGWLAASAACAGAKFIDYHTPLRTEAGAIRSELSVEGVHLNAAGYAVMEPVLLAGLKARR